MCKNTFDKFSRIAKILLNVWLNCVNPVSPHVYFLERESVITKRIKAACICQTLHFMLKEDAEHQWAVKQVEQGVEYYKQNLERNRTQYKIVEETAQPDGSMILKIIKQYNSTPVGDSMD